MTPGIPVRRLVLIGYKKPAHRTIHNRVDNRFGNHPEVLGAGLPTWRPRTEGFPDAEQPDYDLLRKQWVEDQIARGGAE